jgi:polyisoprenoid-binding protein YceI
MKFHLFFLTFLFSLFLQAREIPLDTNSSRIEWLGKKLVPGGDHNGVVKIKKGHIIIDKNMKLAGGTIVIDMKSIEDKDLNGQWKSKLETHLNSPDFFDTEKNPEANFKIVKVESTRSDLVNITGNLTVKGQTHIETFDLKVENNGKFMTANGNFEIDRNKYGITYNSEANVLKNAVKIAKDKIIKDKILLTVNLTTHKF